MQVVLVADLLAIGPQVRGDLADLLAVGVVGELDQAAVGRVRRRAPAHQVVGVRRDVPRRVGDLAQLAHAVAVVQGALIGAPDRHVLDCARRRRGSR